MRKRRRVIPSRWSSAQEQAEDGLSTSDRKSLVEQMGSNTAGRWPSGCTRTRPLYEAEEAARER